MVPDIRLLATSRFSDQSPRAVTPKCPFSSVVQVDRGHGRCKCVIAVIKHVDSE